MHGGHKDWFGRSWEGLLGRKDPLAGPGLAERSRDTVISARQITDWCEVPAYVYLVFEDGSSISPRVARVPLPANEADRPSCSSSVVSGVPNRKFQKVFGGFGHELSS